MDEVGRDDDEVLCCLLITDIGLARGTLLERVGDREGEGEFEDRWRGIKHEAKEQPVDDVVVLVRDGVLSPFLETIQLPLVSAGAENASKCSVFFDFGELFRLLGIPKWANDSNIRVIKSK